MGLCHHKNESLVVFFTCLLSTRFTSCFLYCAIHSVLPSNLSPAISSHTTTYRHVATTLFLCFCVLCNIAILSSLSSIIGTLSLWELCISYFSRSLPRSNFSHKKLATSSINGLTTAVNSEEQSMISGHVSSWKTRKYLNLGTSVLYPPLWLLTALCWASTEDAAFISFQCSISASAGRFFSLISNFLWQPQIVTKRRISNLKIAKRERPRKTDCPDSQRPYTDGPRQSDFFRSLFVFFQEVKKKKSCKSLIQVFKYNDDKYHSVTMRFDCSQLF